MSGDVQWGTYSFLTLKQFWDVLGCGMETMGRKIHPFLQLTMYFVRVQSITEITPAERSRRWAVAALPPSLACGFLVPGRYCLWPGLLWHSLRAEPFSPWSSKACKSHRLTLIPAYTSADAEKWLFLVTSLYCCHLWSELKREQSYNILLIELCFYFTTISLKILVF